MPLLIGVEYGIDKGFTKSDLTLINGFSFGMIMMVSTNLYILIHGILELS